MIQYFTGLNITKEKEVYMVFDRYTVFDIYIVKRDAQGNFISRSFAYRECETNEW